MLKCECNVALLLQTKGNWAVTKILYHEVVLRTGTPAPIEEETKIYISMALLVTADSS